MFPSHEEEKKLTWVRQKHIWLSMQVEVDACRDDAFYQRAHLIPMVDVGKRETHINWSMVTCKVVAPVTGTTLRPTDPVPADSRQ